MSESRPSVTRSATPSRRGEILSAAIELFYRDGYHVTTMNEIGAALGLTGPALYRHFEKKADILETALLRAADAMERRVERIVLSTADPQECLEALVRDMVEVLVEHPAIVAIAESERRYLSDRARAIYDRSARLRVAEWVGPLTQVRPELSETDARFFVTAAQTMLQQAVRPSHELTRGRTRGLLFRGAMTLLLTRPDRPMPVWATEPGDGAAS